MLSVTSTTATCRLPLDLNREVSQYELIAFASTYEEANCEVISGCMFTFVDDSTLPVVTHNATASFNTATSNYELTITGTGFTDAASDIDFFLAGVQQTVLSASSTEVLIQVDTLTSGLTTNTMNLYFVIGIPEGYTLLDNGITFTPKLISLSASSGSQAGSIITAVVKGVGVSDSITLYDSATTTDICASSRVTAYGQLECVTKALVIAASTELSIQEVSSSTVHACAATDTSACNYQTYDSSTQMTVTSVAVQSATELKFTGTLFPSETCEGFYMSLKSDSCTVESATSVVATFNGGVPTSPTDVTPELRFNATDGSHYAKFDTAAVISNPLSITATTSGLVSSFAGGQTL